MTCICSHKLFKSEKWSVRTKTRDTYYINNGYTNVTKVYEFGIEFETGSNHKKCRKTKKTSFPKE